MSTEPTRASVAASIPQYPECSLQPGVSLSEARDLVDVETRQAREDLRVVAVAVRLSGHHGRASTALTRTIDSDDHLTLVAEAGGALVATLRLTPTEAGHALGMLIARGHRGCGLGTRLVDDAIAWARARAGTTISLGVFPHNAAALRLYEKAGFRTVRRLAGAYTRQTGDVWDVIEMEKRTGGAPRFLRAEHVD